LFQLFRFNRSKLNIQLNKSLLNE